jgi:hypothetical protein
MLPPSLVKSGSTPKTRESGIKEMMSFEPDVVLHTYSPSYLEAEIGKITVEYSLGKKLVRSSFQPTSWA